jgi:hypothetical protein
MSPLVAEIWDTLMRLFVNLCDVFWVSKTKKQKTKNTLFCFFLFLFLFFHEMISVNGSTSHSGTNVLHRSASSAGPAPVSVILEMGDFLRHELKLTQLLLHSLDYVPPSLGEARIV